MATTSSIVPMAASSRSSACGPRSQTAPRSTRHGVAKSLPSSAAPVTNEAWPPRACAPCAAWRKVRPVEVKRLRSISTDRTPASSTASAIACAPSRVKASGFSSTRCLPARAACGASSACTSGGTAKATASTRSSSSSKVATASPPWRRVSACAASGRRAHTASRLVCGLLTIMGAWKSPAQGPAPTRPMRMLMARPKQRCPDPGRGSAGRLAGGLPTLLPMGAADWSTVGAEAWFALRLALLAAVTVALGAAYGTGLRLLPLTSLVRAGVQLAVVALLLRGVLAVPWTAAAFVVLMLTTASWTSAGRTRELWHGRRAAVVGVVAGSLVSLGVVFALGLAALEARYVVATGGIVIGNAMSASTLRTQLPALGPHPQRRGRGLARPRGHPGRGARGDRPRGRARVAAAQPRPGPLDRPGHPARRLRRRPVRRRHALEAAQFQLVVLGGIALAMTVTAVVVVTVAVARRTSSRHHA